MPFRSVATDYRSRGTTDGVEDIEDLAHRHFPLCMKVLFDKLKEEHHLKHQGRLQLQLFLKASVCCHVNSLQKCVAGNGPALSADVRSLQEGI